MLTHRDEGADSPPKFWAKDVDKFLRDNGHDMFKTVNISGFISFLLYAGLVGAFVLLGFALGHFVCPAYNPEEGAKDIISELEDI